MDTIRAKYARGAELDSLEIAALCFACGITLDMSYSAISSSPPLASDLEDAFVSHAEYDSAAFYFNSSGQENEFDELLINNMINGLPAILILKGHAIIADGYNTDGEFHLNWGWGSANPDSIQTVWTNVFGDWTYNDYGIQSGILDIKTNPMRFNFQIEFKEKIELDEGYINEPTYSIIYHIKNSGPTAIYLYKVIISDTNFHWKFDESVNFPDYPVTLWFGDDVGIQFWYTPQVPNDFTFGKLQIFGYYQNNNGHEELYLDTDLKGWGNPGTIIKKDTVSGTWSEYSSPYIIRDNISVAEGKKLIIEAGTKITFQTSSEFNIKQNAQFVAKGTQSDPIIITCDNPDKGWHGLVFYESGSDDTLENCIIKYANRTSQLPLSRGGGISIINSSPFIIHSSITENRSILGGGGIYLNNSNPYIGNTRFENNSAKWDGGALSITGSSSPTLSNVNISHNYAERNGGGIYIDRSSIVNFDSTDRCNIFQNHSDKEIGNDLYSLSDSKISVYLDTFTVLNPDSSHAYPLENFYFVDIKSDPSKILLGNPEVPTEFILSQNYPNPFNPSTKIKFSLPKPETVKIEVYNIIGQKIETLLNKPMPAGYHEVEFNGQNLSSGIYLYKIEAGAWQDVKKMILLH